jgi:hypothetical protein
LLFRNDVLKNRAGCVPRLTWISSRKRRPRNGSPSHCRPANSTPATCAPFIGTCSRTCTPGPDRRGPRISKGGSSFCYPENIDREIGRLFTDLAKQKYLSGLDSDSFANKAAHFLAELNAIHPFREGNGRTQLSFMTALAEQAGHPFALERIDPKAMLDAAITSFGGSEKPLATLIRGLID